MTLRLQTETLIFRYLFVCLFFPPAVLNVTLKNGDFRSVLKSVLAVVGADGVDSVCVLARNGDAPLPAALHVSNSVLYALLGGGQVALTSRGCTAMLFIYFIHSFIHSGVCVCCGRMNPRIPWLARCLQATTRSAALLVVYVVFRRHTHTHVSCLTELFLKFRTLEEFILGI